MTPDPASAGSDRSDVAAKPPEPIQNWLLIFARGLARPTCTSSRTPKFTTPSNPFAPNGLPPRLRCCLTLSRFYQGSIGRSPEYPFTRRGDVVHCLGFAEGVSMAMAPRAGKFCGTKRAVNPERGGTMRSRKSLLLVTALLLLVPAAAFASGGGWMIDARGGVGLPMGNYKDDFKSGLLIGV